MFILSMRDLKLLETEFPIAICRPTGDKCQSKSMFLASHDPHSLIVKSVMDCHLSDVKTFYHFYYKECICLINSCRNCQFCKIRIKPTIQ